MKLNSPLNFKNWIEENRHLLKPPVGNKVVYDDGDFMVMVVGGPNSRKDYHVDPVEEFFYQLEGDMVLKIIENGRKIDISIKEGEIFLLPKNIPHSPQRFENTVGLVIEYKREEGALDAFQWYCDHCDQLVDSDYAPEFEYNEIDQTWKCENCKPCFRKLGSKYYQIILPFRPLLKAN